eukprot:TRINITY_DN10197_c0_g1_i3.p1 TRINITY_DN10197_c0_g1~~TRINITY_DN10197_c0_g1_i3.p1  ORF type:complete len:223 (+),score=52.19 TRINITY_DN10197_c0_g1_i3:26-694(+)
MTRKNLILTSSLCILALFLGCSLAQEINYEQPPGTPSTTLISGTQVITIISVNKTGGDELVQSSIAGGETMYLTGTGFSSSMSWDQVKVYVGANLCSFNPAEMTILAKMACVIPAQTTTKHSRFLIRVLVTGTRWARCATTNKCVFEYSSSRTPKIDGLVPSGGSVSDRLNVYGTLKTISQNIISAIYLNSSTLGSYMLPNATDWNAVSHQQTPQRLSLIHI